jgi:hypothetical protein
VSGDFISPVFVGLLSNDLLPLIPRGDRAAILERAWEERYWNLTVQDPKLRRAGEDDANSILAQTMLSVRRRVLADEKNWLPVLLLNGTSVRTGKRIIMADIDTSVRNEEGKAPKRLFLDAYDLQELIESGDRQGAARLPSIGIRLSTAVTMSARFPIISPAGAIENRVNETVDHTVDGGYYENYGATTALELAEVLKSRFGLRPSVILITNEPTISIMGCGEQATGNLNNTIYQENYWFPTLSIPVDTVLRTRNARGTHAAVNLCGTVGNIDDFAHIRVDADRGRAIPVNWWLSKRVQKKMDEQLETQPNAKAFQKIIGWLAEKD